jgi:uncharacterized protein (TIGR00369 family)
MARGHQRAARNAATPEPWQEPVRGGFPESRLFLSAGIDQLRAMIDGRCPQPPIGRLTGMRLVEVGAGSAAFSMPASSWLPSPQGVIANGALAVLADGPLGCAVQTALPPATPYTTSELSLRLVKPARPGGMFTARGRLVHATRGLGLSEVFIQDQDGRLLAHGSSLCFIRPPINPEAAAGDAPDPGARDEEMSEVADTAHDGPDPFERPTAGEVLPQEVWDRMSGLEVLAGQVAGELPRPPVSHLFGLAPVEVDQGRATFVLPATEWLCSPLHTVEGGVIAMLADAALASAIQTTVPPGVALAMVDLKVNFLRPARPDGRDLVARGTMIHRGRTISVANAEVRNADDKPVALATGSAMILEGRPASLAGVTPD